MRLKEDWRNILIKTSQIYRDKKNKSLAYAPKMFVLLGYFTLPIQFGLRVHPFLVFLLFLHVPLVIRVIPIILVAILALLVLLSYASLLSSSAQIDVSRNLRIHLIRKIYSSIYPFGRFVSCLTILLSLFSTLHGP